MQEEIISRLVSLENTVAEFEDVIGTEADDLRKECGIIFADAMRDHIAKLAEENRLLNIGIIGRVKAGKSSLLNSIFFNGESVLPKAATPMTASLTVLTYGDKFSATVEYFTAKDIEKIVKEHDAYKAEWDKKYEENKIDSEERAKKRGEELDKDKVKRKTNAEMRDNSNFASFDQYERMNEHGVQPPRQETQTLAAKSQSELLGKLDEYVGAKGRMMPYTKSIEIFYPEDALRDICVVDTPGINDTVQSRVARTEEYLKKCDVVFIISPAGQFISNEDILLMDRLAAKEGVRELYLVASQADSSVMSSSVMEETNNDLNKAIKKVNGDLSSYAISTLSGLETSNPEIARQFDPLINSSEERIMVTSALCHAMSLNYDKQKSWDDDMNLVWELLKENYRDYFDNDTGARASLKLLSGVKKVNDKISYVRSKKDDITAQKQADYVSAQAKNISSFSAELLKEINDKYEKVKNNDYASVKEQKKNNEKLFSKGTEAIDGTYEDCVDDFKTSVRNIITTKSRDLFEEAKRENENGEQSRTETHRWTTGWWLWKKHHSENYEVRTYHTGVAKSSLNTLVSDLQDLLVNAVENEKKDWKKSVQNRVTGALTSAVEDVELIDFDMLKTALRRLVNNMELPDLDLGSNRFNSSFSGKIEGNDIDRFLDEVYAYMSNLRIVFNKARDDFISKAEKSAKREKMSGMIFAELKKQLESLEKEIENKESTLDRLKKCCGALEKIA
jgi:hypothetical protein